MTASPPRALTANLVLVNQLLQRGDSRTAIAHCHSLLKQFPDNAEILRYLGLGHLQQQELQKAEACLSRALHTMPESADLLNDVGIVKVRQGLHDEALTFFERALKFDATHRDALNNMATTFNVLNQPERAKSYVDRLIRTLPFSAQAHLQGAENSLKLNDIEQATRRARKAVRLASHQGRARLSLADALEAGGRFRQAKFQYLSVLTREPTNVAALARLLTLKGTRVDPRYAAQAQELLEKTALTDSDRVQLHMGLARHYDHLQQYDAAFAHLEAGNGIKSSNHPFDRVAFSNAIDRIISTFSAEFMRTAARDGSRSDKPVFIVGMPRSGTTLVEQILASHSGIDAGGELPTMINLAMKMDHNGVSYPEQVRCLDQQALERLAQQYLDKINAISERAVRVTDKMPFNFLHLGLIGTLFPRAKIIHCQRDPLDTCLSCLFTTFSERLQFASDLETLGHYYLDYSRLMTHWKSALPSPVHVVQYERLVHHTRQTVSELLEFCGVQWEEGCVEYYRTERGVRTPSRWQVRQPIYANSVKRWTHYEKHLLPLRDMLGAAAIPAAD